MSNEEFFSIIKALVKKSDKNTFERNVLGLASYFPALAKMVLEVSTNEKFEVFLGDDITSLNLVCKDGGGYLYNSPKDELEARILEFQNYALYPALFFYGLGNGVFIKKLLENQAHKAIVVFEPEIEILYIVLNLIDFSAELIAKRLIIANFAALGGYDFTTLCNNYDIFRSARIYALHLGSEFYARFKDDIIALNSGFAQMFIQRLNEIGNSSEDTLIGIKHTISHIPAMISGIALSTIIKERKSRVKTAIVVSTGPSLTKQLPILKTLQGHATIISADSSYPILKKHGIIPDFVTSLERVIATSKFFEEPKSDFDDKIIFMLASLTHPQSVEYMKGRNYALVLKEIRFEMGFNDDDFGVLGWGHSCAHLAYELAEVLEHKRVILIGQDLAFGADGKSHPDEHVHKNITEYIKKTDNIQSAPAYGGNGEVESTETWNLFRREFETGIAIKPENFEVYNATEGGARIAGTIEKPFSELASEIINENKPEFQMIKPLSSAKQAKKLQKFSNHIKETLKFGKKLQNRCEMLFKRLATAVENAKSANADYNELKAIYKEILELKKTLDEKQFKSTFYDICGSLLENEELEFTKIAVKITHNEDEENAKILELVSAHGSWLFRLAGFINATIENIENSSKEWIL